MPFLEAERHRQLTLITLIDFKYSTPSFGRENSSWVSRVLYCLWVFKRLSVGEGRLWSNVRSNAYLPKTMRMLHPHLHWAHIEWYLRVWHHVDESASCILYNSSLPLWLVLSQLGSYCSVSNAVTWLVIQRYYESNKISCGKCAVFLTNLVTDSLAVSIWGILHVTHLLWIPLPVHLIYM